MKDCISAVGNNIQQVISSSGRFLFQFGLYQQCIEQSKMNYNLVSFYDKNATTWTPAFMGLCLPNICSTATITEYLNKLLTNSNSTFQVLEVNQNVSSQQYSINWMFYFTIILLIFIGLLVMVSSLLKRNNSVIFAFDIRNSIKIFAYQEHSPLNVFNGIKSLSMFWIVLGHQFVFGLTHSSNVLTYEHILLQPFFLIIQSGLLAVDIFFFMGGFFVAYSFIKHNLKGWFKYPLAILHRILRFWPSYIILILIYYSLFMHTGSGPQWHFQQISVNFCQQMWRPLLFVDNFINDGTTMCISWGWYLQNDMQIFVFSILILALYDFNKRFGLIGIWITIFLSIGFNFYEAEVNHYLVNTHMSDFSNWGKYFNTVYIKPWTRCTPYLYGLSLGILYTQYSIQHNNSSLMNKIYQLVSKRYKRWIFELIGLSLFLFIIFIPRTLQQGLKWPQFLHSFYLSTVKLFFVIAISMIVLPSLLHKKTPSFVNTVLNNRLFNFLSKVSFWTYLIHLLFIFQWNASRKYDVYYAPINYICLFFGHLTISVVAASIMTLCVQIPFSKLQKYMISKITKSKERINQSKSSEECGINNSVTQKLLFDSNNKDY